MWLPGRTSLFVVGAEDHREGQVRGPYTTVALDGTERNGTESGPVVDIRV